MPYGNRHTESDLATETLRVLATTPSGAALFADLIPILRKRLTLMPGDTKPSTTRLGEQLWEQRVRNITSHKKSPGNFVYRGLLASIPDGLRITKLGQDYIATKN